MVGESHIELTWRAHLTYVLRRWLKVMIRKGMGETRLRCYETFLPDNLKGIHI